MKKNILETVLFIGGILLTVGIYKLFFVDYSIWQDWFCQAMIEEQLVQGYMMSLVGLLCCTGATAYQFKNQIKNWFKK